MADNAVQVTFGAKIDELVAGIKEVNNSLGSVKTQAENVNDSMNGMIGTITTGFKALALIAGAALSFEGLKTAFTDLAAYADQVQRVQSQIGGTLETVTTLSGVAEMSGTSIKAMGEAYSTAISTIRKATSDGFGPANQALAQFRLSARGLLDLPVDQWFVRVTNAVSRFGPSVALTNNVRAAFGAGMASLMPLLLQGGEDFRVLWTQVEEAQGKLSSALPGLTETKAKIDLLALSTRAFAADIFTAMKPAIDAALDAWVKFTRSITMSDIRNALNAIVGFIIDMTAKVAKFFVEASNSIDVFSGKISDLRPRLGADITITGPALVFLQWITRISDGVQMVSDAVARLNRQLHDFLTQLAADVGGPGATFIGWLSSISDKAATAWSSIATGAGHLKTLKDRLADVKSVTFTVGEGASFADRFVGEGDKLDVIPGKLAAIEAAAKSARETLDNLIPKTGSWQAVGQDLVKLNTDVISLGESFTKMAAKDVTAGAVGSAAIKAINQEIKDLQEGLVRQTILLDQAVAQYRISEGEKVEAVRQQTEKTYALELEAARRKLALSTHSAEERQAALNQITEIESRYATAIVKINGDAVAAVQAKWESASTALQGAFNGQLRGLLAGTTSFANAFKAVLGDMIIFAIQQVEKWVFKQLVAYATDLTMKESTEAAKVAVVEASAGAQMASQIGTLLSSIGAAVGSVFASITAFLAPVFGPAAPAAALAIAGGVAASAYALAKSAEQGEFEVTAGLYRLHDKETVLPAPAAQAFRDMAEGGGIGGTHLHLHGQLIDGPSLARFARDNASVFAGALKNFSSVTPTSRR